MYRILYVTATAAIELKEARMMMMTVLICFAAANPGSLANWKMAAALAGSMRGWGGAERSPTSSMLGLVFCKRDIVGAWFVLEILMRNNDQAPLV